MYAIPALLLTTRQVSELNVCWNNLIRRVFGYNKWESVSALLLSLQRLNVKHLIMLRKIHYRAMHFSAKRGIAIACRLSVCLSVCL